jgi:TolA-binding protein
VPVGSAIRAPLDQVIPLRFSDGSELELGSGTEAIISELSAEGASIHLTRGSAQVSVKHRTEASWFLRAGPYAVHVTGTRFDVAWAPDQQRFFLELWEGSVRVSTEGSQNPAVEMVGPERLVIDPEGWHLSRARAVAETAPEPRAAPPAPAPAPAPAAPVKPKASFPSGPTRAAAAPPKESWQAAVGRGDYQAAYDLARAEGLGALARSGSASQLIALAESCRLSGHGSEGVAVLSRLRSRFPNTEEAALAAFQLGRLTGGAQWFRTYLDERPNGELAREALGRLMEALQRSGSHSDAKVAATRYLATYPTGPHAAIAARILEE